MQKEMTAVVKTEAEPGAEIKQVPVFEPSPTQILIEVKTTSICGSDYHIYSWNEWARENISLPHIMGHEVAGEVVEVGEQVTRVEKGDFVSAETHINCGHCYQCRTGRAHICQNMEILGVHTDGVFAEYAAFESRVAVKTPEEIPAELASLQEPLGNAIDTIKAGSVRGKNVLVTGAGPAGLMSIAVARAFGAATITVTEPMKYRRDMAVEMGADFALDPGDDVENHVNEITDGDGVDFVAEMSGVEAAIRQGLRQLTPGGKMAILGLPAGEVTLDLNNDLIFKGAEIEGITGREMYETWYIAKRLLREGIIDLDKLVTHKFSLQEYEKGMKLMEEGRCGKIVLST